MVDGAPIDASPGASGSAGSKRAAPKRADSTPAGADKGTLDEILRKVSELGGALSVVGGRLDGIERREAERAAEQAEQRERLESRSHHREDSSASGRVDGDSDSDASRATYESFDSEASSAERAYLLVDPKRNKHWGARQLSHEADQEPHRFSQHGNQVYDDLRASRAGADGVLGLGLRWLNPGCLFLQTGVDGLADRIRDLERILEFASGETYDALCEMHADLVATYNTTRGAYDIVNGARTLVEGRARVQASGA